MIRTARSLSVRSSFILSNMVRTPRDVEWGTRAPAVRSWGGTAVPVLVVFIVSSPLAESRYRAGMAGNEEQSRLGADDHLIATCRTISVKLLKNGALGFAFQAPGVAPGRRRKGGNA